MFLGGLFQSALLVDPEWNSDYGLLSHLLNDYLWEIYSHGEH